MKIVVIEPLGIPMEKLKKTAESIVGSKAEIVYYDTKTTDSAELSRRGRDADIIVVSNLPLKREVLENCKNLKMISVAFTGVDHIAMDYCREKGIVVSNCAGYSTESVAELVFGMLISLYRNVIKCDTAVRSNGTKDGLVGNEIRGKKFGIVGTGAIGLKVAEIAKVFGCKVYAYSRTQKSVDGITYLPLDSLLAECDIVSLHVPLTEETRGLINAQKLGLMKKNAVLINTARGPVADSEALADALKSGKIAGACIDVFENEPPIDSSHPLLNAPNVIATPHIAFATAEAMEIRAGMVFDNVTAYLDGKPVNVM
ncbi:2-hydroxyacid dehydrogenase [Porcipelethomonas sp.]|uniref:2-hydroxyacid dehydrogenase n=1 Tax=Porcipelethomonas sp. TaxID=2981675 RepID=UPI003EF61BD2